MSNDNDPRFDLGNPCPNCEDGRWETECCSGAGGCSCGGDRVDMGACHSCHGTGVIDENWNRTANCDSIRGLHFIGTGSRGTEQVWPNRGGM